MVRHNQHQQPPRPGMTAGAKRKKDDMNQNKLRINLTNKPRITADNQPQPDSLLAYALERYGMTAGADALQYATETAGADATADQIRQEIDRYHIHNYGTL